MSGHSFCFTGPAEFSFNIIKEKEFVQFATWHTAMDQSGTIIIGYVQFVFKRSEASLNDELRMFKWMLSVNDAQVYGSFLNPLVCSSPPQKYGDPRPKAYIQERGVFMLKTLKKKAINVLDLKLARSAKKALIKASISFLQVPDVPM